MTRIVSGDEVGKWTAARMNASFHVGGATAIGLERDYRLIAGVIFENWAGKSVVCHIAAERYLTWDFLHALADYAYNRLGVHKIIAPVDSVNAQSVKLVSKMGFELESQISEATARGDILLFTMTRQQCRYLEEKHGKAKPPASA